MLAVSYSASLRPSKEGQGPQKAGPKQSSTRVREAVRVDGWRYVYNIATLQQQQLCLLLYNKLLKFKQSKYGDGEVVSSKIQANNDRIMSARVG